MALYWPKEKVALDIIDDPERRPFTGDDSYTVLRVSIRDLSDPKSYVKVRDKLLAMLGKDTDFDLDGPGLPDVDALIADIRSRSGESFDQDPEWDEDDVPVPDEPESIQILARNEVEGSIMARHARAHGQEVRGVSVWSGPVPKGSYEFISPTMRMSTPEYFFLRKANELPFAQAVSLGLELCGKYRTVITQYDRTVGYDFLCETRTSKSRIRRYLRGADGTKEGKHAKRVLRLVKDYCATPVAAYLYLILCLPKSHGGFELKHPRLSVVFDDERGLLPRATGPYLAYDLCWEQDHLAVQYVESTANLTQAEREGLGEPTMRIVYVTERNLGDMAAMRAMAEQVADSLGQELPEQTPEWKRAHRNLLDTLEPPSFSHMRLTTEDICHHLCDE